MLMATLAKAITLLEDHKKVFILAGEPVAGGTFDLLIVKPDARVEHIANSQYRIFAAGKHGYSI